VLPTIVATTEELGIQTQQQRGTGAGDGQEQTHGAGAGTTPKREGKGDGVSRGHPEGRSVEENNRLVGNAIDLNVMSFIVGVMTRPQRRSGGDIRTHRRGGAVGVLAGGACPGLGTRAGG